MRTLGKGVKTRGSRVVRGGSNPIDDFIKGFRFDGKGFLLDEAIMGLYRGGKKAIEKGKEYEAEKAVRQEAFNKRMAEIDRNNPFPKNPEMEKLLGYGFLDFDKLDFGKLMEKGSADMKRLQGKGFLDDIRGGLESGARWMDDNVNPFAAVARRMGYNEGDGIESATRFGRGTTGMREGEAIGDMFSRMRREDQEAKKKLQDAKDSKVREAQRKIDEYRNSPEGRELFGFGVLDDLAKNFKQPENRFAVLPDVYEPSPSNPFNNDISGWIEKERRSTGYYDRFRPAILGEGM
jgi:hypothetical protein